MNLNKQLCHSNPSQPGKDSGLKIRLMVACKWAEAPAAEAMTWAEKRGNKRQYQTFTLKISSSEAVHTVSFMALSNSSSTVRSPDIALLISGPISCSVRRPAWSEHTQIHMLTKTHFSVVAGESVHVVFCTHLQWKSSLWGNFGHQALFLALLKFPEVFLNQECGIKLPHCYFIICWAR